METEFSEDFSVTPDMIQAFSDKGYVIVRKLFSQQEVETLLKNIDSADDYNDYAFLVADSKGNKSAQITWNSPGNDVIGMAARSQKVAGTCAKLIGGEVYHYHSKLVIKDPYTGGERCWHQDYGYWYNNGCLFPDMLTVFLPLTNTTKTNGCLQVLEGSQRAGRIQHGSAGGEMGADKDRVQHLATVCPLKYVEMQAGDALFFHCNLLHMSDQNRSDGRRVAFLPAYNKASNNPVIESHHPRYTPLAMVPNSAILDCKNFTDMTGKDFLDMQNTKSVKSQVQFAK